jgi:hypothetical protein
MSEYFEAAWRDAMVLKDIDTIRTDILEAIAKRFGPGGSDPGPKLNY